MPLSLSKWGSGWEGYLFGTAFVTEYHERAVNYIRDNPQYQTDGGRAGEFLYTKFMAYELGPKAPRGPPRAQ